MTKDHGIFDRYPCFSDLQINPYNIVESVLRTGISI